MQEEQGELEPAAMDKRITLELRGEERSACTSLDLSGCKTGGEWEVRALGWSELTVV